jgi:hypothetical protein
MEALLASERLARVAGQEFAANIAAQAAFRKTGSDHLLRTFDEIFARASTE